MPTNAALSASTRYVIDRAAHCISFDRTFDAPPADVFEAWTEPAHVSCWWDPSGQPLAVCEIDLRPGGQFKFVPKTRPGMPFSGTYVEIVPAERLVFEAMGAVGRVQFIEQDGATKILVEIQCRSDEHLQQFLDHGVQEGTARTLDNLVAHVGRGR